MISPLSHAIAWCRTGRPAALATVTGTWGSSPRPAGSLMAVSADGHAEGSVSGGCVEADVISAARSILAGERSAAGLTYGVSSGRAWEVGLACGGRLDVFVEAIGTPDCPHGTLPLAVAEELAAAEQARRSAVLVRDLGGKHRSVLYPDAEGDGLPAQVMTAVHEVFRTGGACLVAEDGQDTGWFVQAFRPPPRLVIAGAVHIAQALAPMARLSGFTTVIIDPREALATQARFPGETLLTEWPDEALETLGIDGSTAVVTLTHDARLDDPALTAALSGPAFYVGALGSRKTQASRLARLREAGLSEDQLARIRGPVGLAIGGLGAEEIALSIMADIVAVRRGAALAQRPGWQDPA
ncbi:XdhC family protein [Acetobacter sp. AN02]|uniref:XdhC family protein n=1 Tax=Acetobacter sp. AN02 TaxID=2894186 RepID=UPI00243438BC|nr:XdhC family protein [Acetobacter sp. AN02]MDG6095658.1 XdhC family protein [Acetobacter sp. AN02]